MTTIKVRIEEVRKQAAYRPEGYVEDVLGSGVVNGDVVEIEATNWARLIGKYGEPEMPSLGEMAKNFTRSVAWWLINGVPVTRRRDFHARLRQCEGNECGQWLGDRRIARCAACGCAGVKLWLASEKCPNGYWGAVDGMKLREAARMALRRVFRA